jgi:hypothetical protein
MATRARDIVRDEGRDGEAREGKRGGGHSSFYPPSSPVPLPSLVFPLLLYNNAFSLVWGDDCTKLFSLPKQCSSMQPRCQTKTTIRSICDSTSLKESSRSVYASLHFFLLAFWGKKEISENFAFLLLQGRCYLRRNNEGSLRASVEAPIEEGHMRNAAQTPRNEEEISCP